MRLNIWLSVLGFTALAMLSGSAYALTLSPISNIDGEGEAVLQSPVAPVAPSEQVIFFDDYKLESQILILDALIEEGGPSTPLAKGLLDKACKELKKKVTKTVTEAAKKCLTRDGGGSDGGDSGGGCPSSCQECDDERRICYCNC